MSLSYRRVHRLQIALLFVTRDDQIEGLMYLLTLSVGVSTVMAFTRRRSRQNNRASLAKLHPENPKKRTDPPSIEWATDKRDQDMKNNRL